VGINDLNSFGLVTSDVVFEILANGESRWRSKGIREKNDLQAFEVSLTNVTELELRVHAPPIGSVTGAHAVWVEPCIIRPTDTAVVNNPNNNPPKVEPMDPPPPAVELPWRGGRVYLSDIDPFETANGATGIRRDNGEGKLANNKKPTPKGIILTWPTFKDATHAKYRLDDKAMIFQTTVGFDDSHNEAFGQTGVFEVIGDGQSLWKSKTLVKKTDLDSCRIAVEGVKVLELRVSTSKNFVCVPLWLDPMIESNSQVAPPTEWKVGEPKSNGDMATIELPVDGTKMTPELAVSADRTSFYCLESSGLLQRISWTDWKEEARFNIGLPVRSMAVSKSGVVVLVETPQSELWLLDPKTLARTKKGPLVGAVRVSSWPGSTVALAEANPGTASSPKVMMLDLNRFELIGQATDAELSSANFRTGDTKGHTMTPDGKAMIGYTGAGELVRWDLVFTGTTRMRCTFRFNQAGPAIGFGKSLCMAPDAGVVALVSPEGNRTGAPNHPQIDPNSTFIYPLNDLSKPVKWITQGRGATVVGFDSKGLAYSNNGAKDLIRFGTKGDNEKEYSLGGGETVVILPHPDNGKIVVLTKRKLYALQPAK